MQPQPDPTPTESTTLSPPPIKKDRKLAFLRATQFFGLSLAALTLSGLAILTLSRNNTKALAFPEGLAPKFSMLLAGRDISYCYYHLPCKDQNDRQHAIQTPNTDTIMVVKVDGSKIHVLSIPRDTNVGPFDWKKTKPEQKVNGYYWAQGPKGLVQAVETITGEHIDSYVIVRADYVERVINALGGLDVTVPEGGIEWVDKAAGVDFKLDAGSHHLDGKDAVLFMRIRKGFGDDYGRIDHQKQALTQLASQLKTPRGLTAIPTILGGVSDGSVETNADPNILLAMRPYLSQVKLSFATLPTDTIAGTFNLAVNPERLAAVWGDKPLSRLPSSTTKIKILDASGANLGEGLKRALFIMGYTAISVQTAPVSKEASQVFTQQAVSDADNIASLLNVPRLQGERFPVEADEVGILLTAEAKTQLAALQALSPTQDLPENP